MELLKIKDIKFKQVANIGTFKEFNGGKSEYLFDIVVTTNIPDNLNPMNQSSNRSRFVLEGIPNTYENTRLGQIIGYHMSDDDLILNFGSCTKEEANKLTVYYFN